MSLKKIWNRVKAYTQGEIYGWTEERLKQALGVKTLAGAGLRGFDLRGAELSYTKLQGANLRAVKAQEADLTGADLSGAIFKYVCLEFANLRGAMFQDANLFYVRLKGADIREANFRGALNARPEDFVWTIRNFDTILPSGVTEGHISLAETKAARSISPRRNRRTPSRPYVFYT